MQVLLWNAGDWIAHPVIDFIEKVLKLVTSSPLQWQRAGVNGWTESHMMMLAI
jgi:hypothetical protein